MQILYTSLHYPLRWQMAAPCACGQCFRAIASLGHEDNSGLFWQAGGVRGTEAANCERCAGTMS